MQFYTNKAILLSYIPAGPVCQKTKSENNPFFSGSALIFVHVCPCLTLKKNLENHIAMAFSLAELLDKSKAQGH